MVNRLWTVPTSVNIALFAMQSNNFRGQWIFSFRNSFMAMANKPLRLCTWYLLCTDIMNTLTVHRHHEHTYCAQTSWTHLLCTDIMNTPTVHRHHEHTYCAQTSWTHLLCTDIMNTLTVHRHHEHTYCAQTSWTHLLCTDIMNTPTH